MTSATGEIQAITFHAVVTRADGTVEDLGVVSEFKKDELEAADQKALKTLYAEKLLQQNASRTGASSAATTRKGSR